MPSIHLNLSLKVKIALYFESIQRSLNQYILLTEEIYISKLSGNGPSVLLGVKSCQVHSNSQVQYGNRSSKHPWNGNKSLLRRNCLALRFLNACTCYF